MLAERPAAEHYLRIRGQMPCGSGERPRPNGA